MFQNRHFVGKNDDNVKKNEMSIPAVFHIENLSKSCDFDANLLKK